MLQKSSSMERGATSRTAAASTAAVDTAAAGITAATAAASSTYVASTDAASTDAASTDIVRTDAANISAIIETQVSQDVRVYRESALRRREECMAAGRATPAPTPPAPTRPAPTPPAPTPCAAFVPRRLLVARRHTPSAPAGQASRDHTIGRPYDRGIPDGSWTGTLSDLGWLFGHWRGHDRHVNDPFNTGLEDLEEAGIGVDLSNSDAGIIASVHADAFWSFNDALFDASEKGIISPPSSCSWTQGVKTLRRASLIPLTIHAAVPSA